MKVRQGPDPTLELASRIYSYREDGESWTDAVDRYARTVLMRHPRTVHRWLAGESPMPAVVADSLTVDSRSYQEIDRFYAQTRRCDLCGDPLYVDETHVTIGEHTCHVDCAENLIENEHERRGVRQAEQDFASYHGGTAPYPFTDDERQEEQARVQREHKR